MVWYVHLLGFLAAYFLLLLYHKSNRSPYDKDQVINLMTFQIIGVLLMEGLSLISISV